MPKDLPNLFCLTLDHILEFEHANPDLPLEEILNLYEKFREETYAFHNVIARLWELKDVEWHLPLTIDEIRNTFPFPIMSPTVERSPEDMKKKFYRKGLPIWRWSKGDLTIFFFASESDFIDYSETDEFLSSALEDAKGVLCLFPPEEVAKEEKGIIRWLKETGKLKFVKLHTLVSNFLFSLSSKIEGEIPGDLPKIVKEIMENEKNPILLRKVKMYWEALTETIKGNQLQPEKFYKGEPEGAGVSWGARYIKQRDIDTQGILALVFAKLTSREKNILANLKRLFMSYNLLKLLPRGGFRKLVDEFLPYGKMEKPTILKLRNYWKEEEKEKLQKLARIVPLYQFLKLHQNENVNRMLEALWRVTREEFETSDLNSLITKIESNIIPVLNKYKELLEKGTNKFNLSGIKVVENQKDEKYQILANVYSEGSLEELLEITKEAEEKGSPLIKSIISILLKSLIDNISSDIDELDELCSEAKEALDDLENIKESLIESLWKHPRAIKFLERSEKTLKELICNTIKMDGILTLKQLKNEADRKKDNLEKIFNLLSKLEDSLEKLENIFNQIRED